MEIFMDDFTPYGVSFQEALQNLEKVLKRCIQAPPLPKYRKNVI
jgi:hypothetical protein